MCKAMKIHIRKTGSALATALFLLSFFMLSLAVSFMVSFTLYCMTASPLPVSAAGSAAITVTIPVSVAVSGGDESSEVTSESSAQEETYTFRLTALNSAPAPESDAVTISGAGSAEFSIDFERVGVYQYTVTQEGTAAEDGTDSGQDGGTYDDTVFYVTVTVQNLEDGGIAAVVAAHKGNAEGDKCEIVFENTVGTESEETEASAETSTTASTEPYLSDGYMAYDPPEATTEAADTEETPPETNWLEESYESESWEEDSDEESSDESAGADAPQTGDHTPVAFWLALMAASFWVTLGAAAHGKRMRD
ncbi:MAG: hypothetical protein LUI13_04755 [Lachnospiraceae bacterium]|nr:hypothetical protein [Lachnospiraceae bacterium]